jgi:hypothetical protein
MHEKDEASREGAIRVVLRAPLRHHKHQIHSQSTGEHTDHAEYPASDQIG